MAKHFFSFLALGDSYTIGEAVPIHESFPYQALQILRNNNFHFHAPEIIAKTGWTTAGLAQHILHIQLNEQYDFVTLLIGVNNQYQKQNIDDYRDDFEFLLKKALHLSTEKSDHVIVLSIPDWGVTPFAKKKDRKKIAAEIDAYNKINQEICMLYKVTYINITTETRQAATDLTLLAEDGLHPSGKTYQEWAKKLSNAITDILNK